MVIHIEDDGTYRFEQVEEGYHYRSDKKPESCQMISGKNCWHSPPLIWILKDEYNVRDKDKKEKQWREKCFKDDIVTALIEMTETEKEEEERLKEWIKGEMPSEDE